jgi:transposase-like protein
VADSTGATIDFWFSAERDAAAKRFFQKALQVIPGRV